MLPGVIGACTFGLHPFRVSPSTAVQTCRGDDSPVSSQDREPVSAVAEKSADQSGQSRYQHNLSKSADLQSKVLAQAVAKAEALKLKSRTTGAFGSSGRGLGIVPSDRPTRTSSVSGNLLCSQSLRMLLMLGDSLSASSSDSAVGAALFWWNRRLHLR